MKILFFIFLSFLSCITHTVSAQQSNSLQQYLQNAKARADAIKKSNPNPNKKQQPGLPPGYDNSWKITVTLIRTVNGTTDLSPKIKCEETKKGSLTYTLHADLSSDKVIASLNGDDIQIRTDYDDKFRPYAHPFKGSYNIDASGSSTTTTCDGSTNSQISGGSTIDPAGVVVSFAYNKKSKEGDFSVELPSDYEIHGSGKMISRSKNSPSVTIDMSDGAKAQISMLTAMCGAFASWNHPLTKDASVQQAMTNSPVNGGQASIGETKYGYEVSYSETKTVSDVPANYTGTNYLTYTTSVHILITNQNPPTLEAILEPDDATAFQNFIPEGPKVDGSTTHGNMLSFHIRIIDKKNSGKDVTASHPFTVTYSLDKVSTYKGICMNYPKDGADEKPDLRWDTLVKAESHVASYTDNTITSKTREGDQAIAFVTSYDYASYGILKARVHLDDDDLDLEAHLKNKPDEPFVTIPVDDNHNKIADKWEKDVGTYPKTSDADFDEDEMPKKQKRNGDGYTLFEEYRGFKVKDNIIAGGSHEDFKNGHVRMDPGYKDIFINDVDGLFKRYYSPYNPSNLCWHYIEKDEMIFNASGKDPQNRWVNFNKVPDHFYANQYALIMADKPAEQGGGVLGEQLNYNKVKNYDYPGDGYLYNTEQETGFGFEQPVKNTVIIDVYTGEIARQAKFFNTDQQQGAYDIMITGVINHEIGHALGITHHRLESGEENDSSKVIGVTGCSMRYLSPAEMSHRFLVFRAPYYCHKEDTWKEVVQTPANNAEPGKAVPLQTATHPSNNCFGQIDVKSDP